MEEIKLTGSKILVKRLESEEKIGNIIVPKKKKQNKATVIDVGPGESWQTMEVKKGDKVLLAPNTGTEIKIDGQEYLIVKQDDVLMFGEDI